MKNYKKGAAPQPAGNKDVEIEIKRWVPDLSKPRPAVVLDWTPKEVPSGVIPVPSPNVTYALSAKHVFKALADSGRFFHDGKQVIEYRGSKYIPLTPERLCSVLDGLGTVARYMKDEEICSVLWSRARLTLDDSRILLETDEARDLLPGV